MAIEALASIALASNVVHFVEFLCKLFNEAREIRASSSGVSASNSVVQRIVTDLENLLGNIDVTIGQIGSTPDSFKDVVDQCRETNRDLSSALNKLKRKSTSGRWSSFRSALREVWATEEIDSFTKRLGQLELQMNLRLLLLLR